MATDISGVKLLLLIVSWVLGGWGDVNCPEMACNPMLASDMALGAQGLESSAGSIGAQVLPNPTPLVGEIKKSNAPPKNPKTASGPLLPDPYAAVDQIISQFLIRLSSYSFPLLSLLLPARLGDDVWLGLELHRQALSMRASRKS